MPIIIPISIFMFVVLSMVAAYGLFGGRPNKANERLKQLRNQNRETVDLPKESPVTRIAEKMAEPINRTLLVVSVEAGLGVNQALVRVSSELKAVHPEISEEFDLVNTEIRIGREREEALRNLSERTGVDDLRGLCAMLIQADRFGASIARAIRVYSDSMRTRRRQRAEQAAQKAAVTAFTARIVSLPHIVYRFARPGGSTAYGYLRQKVNADSRSCVIPTPQPPTAKPILTGACLTLLLFTNQTGFKMITFVLFYKGSFISAAPQALKGCKLIVEQEAILFHICGGG
ncbi:MAG: type II secretion system F family protein [Blastocatellia bacterium]